MKTRDAENMIMGYPRSQLQKLSLEQKRLSGFLGRPGTNRKKLKRVKKEGAITDHGTVVRPWLVGVRYAHACTRACVNAPPSLANGRPDPLLKRGMARHYSARTAVT